MRFSHGEQGGCGYRRDAHLGGALSVRRRALFLGRPCRGLGVSRGNGVVGMPLEAMKFTALALNVLVAGIGAVSYTRAGDFAWRTFYPFAVLSILAPAGASSSRQCFCSPAGHERGARRGFLPYSSSSIPSPDLRAS